MQDGRKKYTYRGSVYGLYTEFYLGEFASKTLARSPEEAARNLRFQARKKYGQPVYLAGQIKLPPDEKPKVSPEKFVQLKINL